MAATKELLHGRLSANPAIGKTYWETPLEGLPALFDGISNGRRINSDPRYRNKAAVMPDSTTKLAGL